MPLCINKYNPLATIATNLKINLRVRPQIIAQPTTPNSGEKTRTADNRILTALVYSLKFHKSIMASPRNTAVINKEKNITEPAQIA